MIKLPTLLDATPSNSYGSKLTSHIFRSRKSNCSRLATGVGKHLARALEIGLLATAIHGGSASSEAQVHPELRVQTAGGPNTVQIQWHNVSKEQNEPPGRTYELQASTDLEQWWPVDERISSARLDPGATITLWLPTSEQKLFYRVLSIPAQAKASVGAGGAETFGFSERFDAALKDIGEVSPFEFAAMFPDALDYLPEIGWDPKTAMFWDEFNLDTNKHNVGKRPEEPGYRSVDYRLDEAELALFRKNGFVVSERLGTGSFADAFYKLWKNDLPVFVSTDAILQAWHRSYDMMLAEVETAFLSQGLDDVLTGMHGQLEAMRAEVGEGILKESIADADYFLAVARSLLSSGGAIWDRGKRAPQTLQWIRDAHLTTVPDLFGSCRVVDFSQFTPRGHYTESALLQRYFQAMIWCGRIDLRVAGGPSDQCDGPKMAPPRELGTAIVLWELLVRSGQFSTWAAMDRVISAFAGWTDSMTFAQLGGVLAGAGPRSVSQIQDLATLERIQDELVKGTLGTQNIRSDVYFNPFGDQRSALPRSFTVMGQRFTPDSWVLGKSVYPEIFWNGAKIERRVPSGLDVAFSVFGNNEVVPELLARITRLDAHESTDHTIHFRDGYPFQHNLAAARIVIDQLDQSAWEENVYMGWIDALRALSAPTTDSGYPEAMRTRAWAAKTLNTQMASWTQLRHDNILYAKQSYTGTPICFYPAGYVEPRPEFWARLEQLARKTTALISGLSYNGYVGSPAFGVPGSAVQERQISFLKRFGDTLGILHSLAQKELAREPFNENDTLFVRNLIEQVGWDPFGSGSVRRYDGWYPGLFYRPAAQASSGIFHQFNGAERWDLLTADVHTDPPCDVCGDEGGVLHQGVGNVHLLMIAVDCGEDRSIYAGPVLSYFEYEMVGPNLTRSTDEEWKTRWSRAAGFGDYSIVPPHPEWTRSFLAPYPVR